MANQFRRRLVQLRSIRITPAHRGLVWRMIVRCYAAGILLILVYCGYLAVDYLLTTVFYPPPIPLEVEQWPVQLQPSALRSTAAAGVEQPAPRAPLGHYHQIEQWFQPDRLNGCTRSGCHQPLPHDMRAKIPAFANFHATFLACQMCHQPAAHRPGPARWINIQTGQPQGVPPILQLMNLLEINAQAVATRPAGEQAQITSLLRQAIADRGGDPDLDALLAQMQSSQPGSPVWTQAVSLLAVELPQEARGEYGAKLIWADLAGNVAQRFQQSADQAAQLASAAGAQQRQAVIKQIHISLAAQPVKCLACHADQPGMLDFAAVGFSPKRAAYLSNLEIARLMQRIRQGERFYLPNLEFAQ
jgi:hypothetical protein